MKFLSLSLIFKNFWYKAAALILAVLIWGIVQGEEILEINRRINVQINSPENLMVMGGSMRTKDATLRGPRVLLAELINKPIDAIVNLPANKKGNIRIRIDKEYIPNWNSRIDLTVHDAYLNLVVDEKDSKMVNVREILKGAPAEGYIVEKVTITPPKIKITGLKSEIAKVNEVITEAVDISGLQQSKTFETSISKDQIQDTEVSNEEVKVNLQIGDSKINRRFKSIPIQLVGSEYLSTVRPKYVSIVIQGTPGILSFVRKEDLRAVIELRSLSPGKFERDIQIKIPPDTVLIETIPEKAVVEILSQKRID